MDNNRPINVAELPEREPEYRAVENTAPVQPEPVKKEVPENVYKLHNPITFEGEYITEVILDLESLSGRDLEEAAESLTATQKTGILENEKAYLAAVATKSMNMPVEFMKYIKARDYTELTIRVQSFLLV